METIKRLIEKLAGKSKNDISDEVLRNQSIEANYEGIIAELKLELERSKETIKSLEEALSTKDELLKKICEELRLANLKIEELKGIIKKLQSDRYGTSSEKEKSKEKDPEGNNRQRSLFKITCTTYFLIDIIL
jgi:uncharacterized protein YaaN involved in tellurite resistance